MSAIHIVQALTIAGWAVVILALAFGRRAP
jgi:hypothetical protein